VSVRQPIAVGGRELLVASGLAYFAPRTLGGDFVVDVLPGMLLSISARGIAFTPC